MVCGKKNKITIHHLRDIHTLKKKKQRRYPLNGVIYLCRDRHDIVEEIATKKKLVNMGYKRGFADGQKSK